MRFGRWGEVKRSYQDSTGLFPQTGAVRRAPWNRPWTGVGKRDPRAQTSPPASSPSGACPACPIPGPALEVLGFRSLGPDFREREREVPSFLRVPGKVPERPLIGLARSCALAEPITVARGLGCSDWPGLGHVPVRDGEAPGQPPGGGCCGWVDTWETLG